MELYYTVNVSNFSVIALMAPDDSWVAKWQRVSK